ncbi:unnamed protein product [Hyaloperonospora brassicae]|uniref:PPM-type phosphatase domain-containing protein n=1 Tax=Hyaloperonospora brassicae TaxID=162125 RepID=A0AAV0V5S2_HYABA|nr:unnamed protein product [Hyaloperonospora brassicae]CAI5743400.1 unnamed protein product [Hyaloperonospora brassicae]
MLLRRQPVPPSRRPGTGPETFTKVRRCNFFRRQLRRFLRWSSAVTTEPSSCAPGEATQGTVAARLLEKRAETAVVRCAVDPIMVLHRPTSSLQLQCFGSAASTRTGGRRQNEDRLRAIDNLDRYGRELLEVAPPNSSLCFRDLLQHRGLEDFVEEAHAPPALAVNHLLLPRAETQFFGVYDGHGGAQVSSLLALLFPVYVLAAPEYASDLAAACHSATMAMDEEIRKRELKGGATAVTLLLRGETAVLSNTGDCRAILVAKRDQAGVHVTQLTTDHKASNEQEKRRIEESGGMVLYVRGVARVNGRLAVARAFGDSELGRLVIADPEVTVHALHQEDEYIVLGSDGLWDVLTNEQVASYIGEHPLLDVQEMAHMLTHLAVELGTSDNVTVIVVDVRSRAS